MPQNRHACTRLCTSPTTLAGFLVPELYNIDFARVDDASKAIAEDNCLSVSSNIRVLQPNLPTRQISRIFQSPAIIECL